MKLIELTLDNFRQFYGESKIDFSLEKEKPITLIHGENGAGKSTLLNAITWCLYDVINSALTDQKDLVNETAIDGNPKAKAKVQVKFTHAESAYVCTRTFSNGRPSDMKMLKRTSKGSGFEPVNNPWEEINRIVPFDIHQYYFFSGESGNLTDAEQGGEQVRISIETILGMTAAKDAIEYLHQYDDVLIEGITKNQDLDNDIKALGKEVSRLKTLKIKLGKEKKELAKERDEKEKRLKEINEILKAFDETDIKKIQTDIGNLDQEFKKVVKEVIDAQKEEVNLVRNLGWQVLGNEMLEESAKLLEKATKSGEIPGKYKEEIVRKSIDDLVCALCGSKAGKKEVKNMQKALDELVTSPAQNRALDIKADIKKYLLGAENFSKQSQSLTKRQDLLDNRQDQLRSQLSKKRKLKENIEVEDIKKLVKEEKDLEGKVINIKSKIIILDDDINLNDNELLPKEKAFNEKAEKGANKIVESLNKKRNIIKDAIAHGEDLIQKRKEEGIKEINKVLKKIYKESYRKSVDPKVDENFKVTLFREGERLVTGLSSGERKFLNLAFALSLSQYSRQLSKETAEDYFISAASAPFFVDAPFDALGEGYISSMAQYFSGLSDQVGIFVLPVDSKQVAEKIKGKIGKEYVISWHSKDKKDPKKNIPESLTLRNKKYSTIKYNSDFEQSELLEVT